MGTADTHALRADADRRHAVDTAGRLLSKYAEADYAARAAGLAYKVEHGIPVYGSDRQ